MILIIFEITVALFFVFPVIFIVGFFLLVVCVEIWEKFWSPIFHGRLPWD